MIWDYRCPLFSLVLTDLGLFRTQNIIACSRSICTGKGIVNWPYRSCSAVHPDLGQCWLGEPYLTEVTNLKSWRMCYSTQLSYCTPLIIILTSWEKWSMLMLFWSYLSNRLKEYKQNNTKCYDFKLRCGSHLRPTIINSLFLS